jgi:hypothetical protein
MEALSSSRTSVNSCNTEVVIDVGIPSPVYISPLIGREMADVIDLGHGASYVGAFCSNAQQFHLPA